MKSNAARKLRSIAHPAAPAPAFFPLKGGRKSDQVFDQISQFIQSGRFPPGARLPPERDLATLFNTSRQTVREAIYRAELVGLVEVRHGAGTFVAADKAHAAHKPVNELVRIEAGKVGQFFEIRRALEGWCAAQAAKSGSKPHVAAMKARLDAMRTLDITSDAWEKNDIEFHASLAAATGNPLAVRMMAILRDSFSAFYRLKRYIPTREEQKLIWQHHADVYEAVRRRSPGRARAAIIAHMDFIEARLAESLEAFDANLNDKD
jgi:GntR family transcriptional repressor for pyruvate dehydrogenase complex